jgi:poly(hydroxyalkanoate) depolymerase family esterase
MNRRGPNAAFARLTPFFRRPIRGRTQLVWAVARAAAIAGILGSAGACGPSSGGVDELEHVSLSVQGDVYPYAVYVPPGLRTDSAAPLVVVLHGCTMTADQMAVTSQYDAIARRDRFVVLYPDVGTLSASSGRCWQGISAPDLEGRAEGDAGAIAAMTNAVITRWHSDRQRVYAIGISAGGYEAAILAADYPDLYAAIGIHSGAAYMAGQFDCSTANQNTELTNLLAETALTTMGRRARVMPVFVIHGDADQAVPYPCGQQAISQWLHVDDAVLTNEHRPAMTDSPISTRQATVPGGRAFTVFSYADDAGCVVAQLWTVHGMGHFWSGGSTDPSVVRFSDPHGPSATEASWAFFSHWALSGPLLPCTRAG